MLFSLPVFFAVDGITDPLAPIPAEQRDAASKRLRGYVEAHRARNWKTLYGFVSDRGRGDVDELTFVSVMMANHGEDFAQYPDLQTFNAYLTRKNGDGYDIYGCAGSVREDEHYIGIAEIHAVYEHQDWFFTGWTYRDSSEDSCKQLTNPKWRPDAPLNWNKPMEEVAHRRH